MDQHRRHWWWPVCVRCGAPWPGECARYQADQDSREKDPPYGDFPTPPGWTPNWRGTWRLKGEIRRIR